jgi:hypothetical protein
MNTSKTKDFRFWKRWIKAGAVGRLLHWQKIGYGPSCGQLNALTALSGTFSVTSEKKRCPVCQRNFEEAVRQGIANDPPPFPGTSDQPNQS